jgi:hypothetical protein
VESQRQTAQRANEQDAKDSSVEEVLAPARAVAPACRPGAAAPKRQPKP